MENFALNLVLEISRLTGQIFVSGLWQGIVLLSAVALAFRLLSRISASARFIVWGVAFALVILMPALHVARSSAAAGVPSVHVGAGWGLLIAGTWAVLTVARAGRLLLQIVRLQGIWRRAKPLDGDGPTFALLRNGPRAAQLCTSVEVDSPCVIGFFAPRLLLPEALLPKLTEEELLQIALHECEHLRRRDDWINLLQKCSLVLFPLNPALLWMDWRMGVERELACDAGVVDLTAAPFNYARCLTRLAEHRLHCRSIALTLSIWSRQSELAQRVHSLLGAKHRASQVQARVSIALLSAGLIAGAVEMTRVAPFISFTDAVSAPVEDAAMFPVNPRGARALPVVYRQTATSHTAQFQTTPLNTTAPSGNPVFVQAPVIPSGRGAMQPEQPDLRHRAPVKPGIGRSRFVLTTDGVPLARTRSHHFHQAKVRPALAYLSGSSTAYAAVPFGYGWLIIQL